MEERLPDVEGNCEYIEQAGAKSRQGMILQLGGLGEVLQHLTVKIYHVTKLFTKPRTRTHLLARRQQWKKCTRLIKLYEAMILPVVLHECETGSLTLKEDRRLKVFANRVLRGVFGSKRDKVTGQWRRLHKEELNNLYS